MYCLHIRSILILALLITGCSIAGFAQPLNADFTVNKTQDCSPLKADFTDLSTGSPTAWFWTFGNGNTSTLQNPSAVYVTPGKYDVTLVVTKGNVKDTLKKSLYITVFDNPTVKIAAVPQGGCVPLTVQFDDLSTSPETGIEKWQWDFGDGNSSTLKNPVHTFTATGTYTITLAVTDSNGCKNNKIFTAYITVSSKPSASFSGTPRETCIAPLTVDFTNNSSGGTHTLSYLWRFGDGATSTDKDPSHTYTAPGTYDVTLVTNSGGCKDSVTLNDYIRFINFNTDFTSSAVSGCVNRPIQFTDQSAPGPQSWQWDFGDGTTSTQQNPSHSYSNTGTYTVRLISHRPIGCTDTVIKTDLITINPIPAADFEADTITACQVPFTVQFSDSSANAVSWQWDFGDGNTSTLQNPQHTYQNPGMYSVRLTVFNTDGCPDALLKTNLVGITLPNALFSVSSTQGCIPFTTNFTDQSTSNEPIVTWLWDFGDGTTASVKNPSHTYTTAGSYTVKLIITNSKGCKDSVTYGLIQAGTKPAANFGVDQLSGCVNASFAFSDSSLNASGWLWNFGDGTISSAQNPAHSYTDTGTYTVSLTVSNNGCTDQVTKDQLVTVHPPKANFNLLQDCLNPYNVTFTDQSASPNTWLWTFGDGNISLLQNPQHTYGAPGSYQVKLIVTNSLSGCQDSLIRSINISESKGKFGASPLAGCFPLPVAFKDSSIDAVAWLWEFGDGSTSVLQDPVHTYTQKGLFSARLIVTDLNGCRDTVDKPDYVLTVGPEANFGEDTTTGCVPLTVSFSDSSTSARGLISYLWNFGDGTTSTAVNPVHTYTIPGAYTVALSVMDSDSCVTSYSKVNHILPTYPNPSFSASTSYICGSQTVTFYNFSSGSGLQYLWDFGDGTTSTAVNPVHSYSTEGTYTVTLKVTDVNGCDSTLSIPDIVTFQNPLAAFDNIPKTADCPPIAVNFMDTSLTNIVSWEWDFGDGTTSTQQHPSHLYTIPGLYDVRLIVRNSSNCIDTVFKQDVVHVKGPYGTFTFNPDTGCIPTAVTFVAKATNTASYTWDFGDGNIGSSDSLVHVYQRSGVFYPILILDDGNDCLFTITATDSIVIDTVPETDFNVDHAFSCRGLEPFSFSDLTYSTRPLVSWEWDFGDGNSSNLQNPVHQYGATGVYTVRLIVTNNLGCSDTIIKPDLVRISAGPQALFSLPDTSGCVPYTAEFSDNSAFTDSLVSWRWDFGDGNSDSVQHPQHTYTQPGTYQPQLIITDKSGCSDTLTRTVIVHDLPSPGFQINTGPFCSTLSAQFIDQSVDATDWEWDFGDGNTSSSSSPSHTYQQNGEYYIKLKVYNQYQCSDSIIQSILISKGPDAAFSASETEGCKPFAVKLTDETVSQDQIIRWEWDFGEGNTDTIPSPQHIYPEDGLYTIRLIATDVRGCSDTSMQSITVHPRPEAAFRTNPETDCISIHVQYVEECTGAVSWEWNFGDEVTSTLPSPEHTYLESGTYPVRLIASNEFGCTDTAINTYCVFVTATLFIPNAFSPNHDELNDRFMVSGYSINTYLAEIYDRWGSLVYRSDSMEEGWDGTYKGKDCPAGSYIYHIRGIGLDESAYKQYGTVNLVR